MTRGWIRLLEGAHMLCALADRALGEDLDEIGAAIAQRSRELLERAALEAEIEMGLGPSAQRKVGEFYDVARFAIAKLRGLEVRLRGLERLVEQQRRERARCSVS